jgi:hypothetical protein
MNDKFSKSIFDFVSVIKDNVIANIVKANRMGELKIEEKQLQKLFLVINSTVNDSYQNSIETFSKMVHVVDSSEEVKKNKS